MASRKEPPSASKLPVEYLRAASWLICGIVGLIALIAALIFDPWSAISNWLAPQPAIGSLPIGLDPSFRLEIDPKRNTASAELYADLVNQNDRMVRYDAELRATVNGKDLDAPVRFGGVVAAHASTMLIVRFADVPIVASPEAFLRYNVTYSFTQGTNSRRTSKRIHWRLNRMPAPPAPDEQKGTIEHRIIMNTDFSDEVEE
jgi:hypothetical protein